MGSPVIKIILFVFNFLFFVNGALLLSFGIVGVANPTALVDFIWWLPGVSRMAYVINIPSVIVSSAVFMIVLGSIMIVFGFLGCAGVAFSSKWMLFFYWILLIALILVEIALIIYAAVSPSAMATNVQTVMYTSLHKNFAPVSIGQTTVKLPSNLYSVAWVAMQFEVACCGVVNASDYSQFKWNNSIALSSGDVIEAQVPPSCCALKSGKTVPEDTNQFENLQACLTLQSYYNAQGCYIAVHKLIVQYSYIPIGICASIIVIEVIALIMACHLWRQKTTTQIA